MKRNLLFIAILALFGISAPSFARQSYLTETLPPWQEGFFDIHHISTARGECQFLIYPDGTTMLIDAGDQTGCGRGWEIIPPLPDASKTPAQWIALYVDTFSPTPGKIDYVMLTHFHGDHMGNIPAYKDGGHGYKVSGISELANYEKFGKYVDRGYPDYDYPSAQTLRNKAVMPEYIKFVEWQVENNKFKAEIFVIGSHEQFAPLRKSWDFDAWNIASNARLTTGNGLETKLMSDESIDPEKLDENMLSNVMLFRYGPFKYYTGGDVPGKPSNSPNTLDRDYESQIAEIVAPCDVMKVNHHGYWDSVNPNFLWKMAPDVIIIPAIEAKHPVGETMARMCDRMYPGKRMIFATSDAGRAQLGEELWQKMTAVGHIVVRAFDNGTKFQVFVLDATSRDYHLIYKSDVIDTAVKF